MSPLTFLKDPLHHRSESISFAVGNHCRHFAKRNLTSVSIKHSYPIPLKDGAKWRFVSPIGHQYFVACCCHPPLTGVHMKSR